MKNSNKKGFTITKLISVIVVIAILVTASVVGYTNFINKSNDSVALKELTQIRDYYIAGQYVAPPSEVSKELMDELGLKGEFTPGKVGENPWHRYTIKKGTAYWNEKTGEITSSKPKGWAADDQPGHSEQTHNGILPAPTAETVGKTFTGTVEFMVSKDLSATPLTYEAWIKLQKNFGSRGGVILGNYSDGTVPAFSFEINEEGNPRLYYHYSEGQGTSVVFDSVKVNTGEWLHLVIVNDKDNQKFVCYVDGEQKQGISYDAIAGNKPTPDNVSYSTPMIGNDYRTQTKQFFKGQIHSVAVYSDVRTKDEIKADKYAYGKDELIAAWDVSGGNPAWIEDVSGNGYDVSLPKIFSIRYAETALNKNLSETPLTYEASINLPNNYTDYPTACGGVILGNIMEDSNYPAFSFEIAENGWPKLYYQYGNNDSVTVIFNKVNVNTGNWLHLSIVNDTANKQFVCYINGEAKQTVPYDVSQAVTVNFNNKDYFKSISYSKATRTEAPPIDTYNKPIIGNDSRNTSNTCFKGKIRAIAVYNDVRTADEIGKDVGTFGTEGLIAGWHLRQATADGNIKDLSGNGHDVPADWIAKKTAVTDYAYSFAVVPDTQAVNYLDSGNYSKIYEWIAANKDEKKIEYVMGLGDITDKDLDEEWFRAAKGFDLLASKGIPYSVVIGNHDGIGTLDITKFNKTIGTEYYSGSLGGKYDENFDNTWRKVEIGGTKYLIFTLGYGANDAILSWASDIIEANLDYNVIITTHAYLYRDGTTLDINDDSAISGTDIYGKVYNHGDDIYNELISKYNNIVLVLSGHVSHPYIVQRSDNGAVQFLIDHQYVDSQLKKAKQDTTGMVAMFYFSEDGNVTVEYYSTVYEMYYRAENQFSFRLNIHN